MAAFAQFGITSAAYWIVLNGGARPMINGGPQAHVTGLPHDDYAAFAAAPGHRRNPAQTAQSVIISSTQGLPRLGEQRGEDDPSDSRQGPQDRHVTLLRALPRFGFLGAGQLAAEDVELAVRRLDLLVHELQPHRHGTDMSSGRLGRAASDRERRLPQQAQRRVGVDAADAMGV